MLSSVCGLLSGPSVLEMLSSIAVPLATRASVLSTDPSSALAPVGIGADAGILAGVVVPAVEGTAVRSVVVPFFIDVLSVVLSFQVGSFPADSAVVGAEVLPWISFPASFLASVLSPWFTEVLSLVLPCRVGLLPMSSAVAGEEELSSVAVRAVVAP
ncbi:MAG: hypothetical protein KVP17_003733 [Porospora cf. gigantea B]|uniref:uncharacterized protein n=1 Tax=Porospora cf. gigantea B TaxID=2853592 RepID=UPI003571B11F|nr:MAG: hypothetical protein KVP17_003733 [Porospora cf. gigantea B]